jgi:hypothetical protein
MDHEEDATITGAAFKDTPRLVGEHIEDSLSTYARYSGQNDFLYWIFGMEHAPVKVCLITTSTVGSIINGDTYEDESSNSFTILRKEIRKDTASHYVIRCDDSVIVNGDLTLNVGTGVATIVPTTISIMLYEHLYELDAFERHQTDFKTTGTNRYTPDVGEDTELGPLNVNGNTLASGDKKCRRAIIGKRLSTGDFMFPGSMCKKFNFKSEAGKLSTISTDYIARDKEISDTDSSTWTLKSALVTNDNVIAHHNTTVSITETDTTALSSLGVTSVDLSIEIPLSVDQDTISGLYIAEPIFEGTYVFSTNITLSRHSAATFEALRDAWTSVCIRIESMSGDEKFSLFIEQAKLASAGPDDGDISREPIDFIIGKSEVDVFTENLYGYKNINSSPVLLLVRNTDSLQYMNKV